MFKKKKNKAVVKKRVNVEEILQKKAPGVYNLFPGFLLRYIAKLVHEDDINAVLTHNQNLKGTDFAKAALKDMGVIVEAKGIENIPATGGCLLACNHPLGGLDGLAIISALSNVRTDIKFFVNELLLALKNMDNILVPVNINGNSSRKMLQNVEGIYCSDMAIPIFPSGLVSRRQPDKSICDMPWKKSFITKARQYKKDIVPVWVEGKNSNFFYKFAQWRKRLGIKINIEMFFLPNEMFEQKNKKIVIHFGKPVFYKTLDSSLADMQLARKFQQQLYKKKETIVSENLFENTPAL